MAPCTAGAAAANTAITDALGGGDYWLPGGGGTFYYEDIVPDQVHVLSQGRIVKSGGKDLALELGQTGYAGIDGAPAAGDTAEATP